MNSVFITGGTSGIGLELAKIYLSKGWKVGVCGRDKEKFHQNFEAKRDNIHFYPVDVADREALKAAILNFSKPTGLSLLVASAGMSYPHKSKIPDFERTYRMVHVNLLGLMYAFEAALEIMIPQGSGQLVGISSLAGFNGFPGISGYSATKSGVIKFCETLSMDLKPLGIHVGCVCPGFIDTPLTKNNHHPMPFLMSAHKAGMIIYRSIERKKHLTVFPFFFGVLVRVLAILPRFIYRRVMGTKAINYSKENQKEISK
ncbi:MAG: SDR family NAD(P)-dependent oxidoreductase [Bacteriovoracaceae bacterium]|nr:SDR family NAD(P)-dependent oxidoreductase [Bacteriovoracaceae bacterium]